MSDHQVSITRARLLRHAPTSRQGAEAAAVDIAQDMLLRHLQEIGLLDELAFKGGTSLRKLYAGAQGRFSLDLDFSVRDLDVDAATILDLLVETVRGLRLGPFRYQTVKRRGKRHLTISTDLVPIGSLSSKLDVNLPPWLEPISRGGFPLDIHAQYGGLWSIHFAGPVNNPDRLVNRVRRRRDLSLGQVCVSSAERVTLRPPSKRSRRTAVRPSRAAPTCPWPRRSRPRWSGLRPSSAARPCAVRFLMTKYAQKYGVTANAIAPGFIETDMTAATADRIGISMDEMKKHAAAEIPVGRVGQPEDIAATVAFLVREDAGFVSGQVIYAAGGPKD